MLKPRAYAQLIRLPNLFTAAADPLAGWFIAGGMVPVIWPVGASVCLYAAGMVFNDCFDYATDCRERPERPLPRGEIGRGIAWTLGVMLMAAGLALAWNAGAGTFRVAAALAVLILIYDGVRKLPGLMGACRGLNMLLGMNAPALLWPPLALGLYVTVVTLVARREVAVPATRVWVKRLLLGIIVLDAAMVFAVTGNAGSAAIVLSLLVPAALLGRILAMT